MPKSQFGLVRGRHFISSSIFLSFACGRPNRFACCAHSLSSREAFLQSYAAYLPALIAGGIQAQSFGTVLGARKDELKVAIGESQSAQRAQYFPDNRPQKVKGGLSLATQPADCFG